MDISKLKIAHYLEPHYFDRNNKAELSHVPGSVWEECVENDSSRRLAEHDSSSNAIFWFRN